MTKPVGILGGTFDPVHHGHLRLALECLHAADLAEISLIPAYTPPHRSTVSASATQRMDMLQLATNAADELITDDIEITRGGVSYTVETVQALRQHYGDTPICLIMGIDAFNSIDQWKQWELILDYVHIIVADRPHTESTITNNSVASLYSSKSASNPTDLQHAPAGRILMVNIPMLSISSTYIRHQFANGHIPHSLIPESVLAYITKEGIYTNTT